MGSIWEVTIAAGDVFKWNRAASAGGSSTFCIILCTVVFIGKIKDDISGKSYSVAHFLFLA